MVHLWGRGQATPHSSPHVDEWALCGPVETSWIPPSTSIWPGLYISCSLGPQWTSASSRVHLSKGSSCSEAPTGQRRCFCLPFSFHFCFVASFKPGWTDMLVRWSPAMLHQSYTVSVCCIAVKAWCHTWQVGFVWPISEMIDVNSQTPWLCSFTFNSFFVLNLADEAKCLTWWLLHDCCNRLHPP